jgi:hypothetical protein
MAQLWSGLRALRLSDCPDLSGMWPEARPQSFQPPSHCANVFFADVFVYASAPILSGSLTSLELSGCSYLSDHSLRALVRIPSFHALIAATPNLIAVRRVHAHERTQHATRARAHTHGCTDEAFDQPGNTEAEPESQHHRQGARSYSHVIASSIRCLSQPDPRRDPSHCARALICTFGRI